MNSFEQNNIGGYLNSKETMKILGCQNTTLYYLRKNGYLAYSKIGRKIFYDIKSIIELLEKNRVEKR